MKNANSVFIILLLLITGCAFSCKKKNNVNPSNSKVAFVDLIQSQNITHYRIVYDKQNNVDSIVTVGGGLDTGHNGFLNFTYYLASYAIADGYGNTYSVATNVNGQMTEVLQTDSLFFLYDQHYNSEVDEVDTKTASGTTETTYQWVNGDIISVTSPNGIDSIDYDLSKGGQQGDIWRIYEFLNYGQSYTKTSHLPKDRIHKGVWTQKYYYEFDGDGRITQLMEVINNSSIYVTAPNDTILYNYRY